MMESNILKTIMIAVSRLGNVRVFRNNTGTGWVGEVVSRTNDRLVLKDPRPLNAGLTKGSSDLIGWTAIEVTPEMVGKKLAVFTAIEGKSARGTVTEAQLNFLKRLQADGGIASVSRSPEDAVAAIRGQIQ